LCPFDNFVGSVQELVNGVDFAESCVHRRVVEHDPDLLGRRFGGTRQDLHLQVGSERAEPG
jgi:hypothetical protein